MAVLEVGLGLARIGRALRVSFINVASCVVHNTHRRPAHRLVDLRMVVSAQLMNRRYLSFNRPIIIRLDDDARSRFSRHMFAVEVGQRRQEFALAVTRGPRMRRSHKHALSLLLLSAIARDFATSSGEPAPSAADVYTTTGKGANVAVGGQAVDSDQPAYVIVLHGAFAVDDSPLPASTARQTGSVMTLVVDAATMRVTDRIVGNQEPATSSLGQPVQLSPKQLAARPSTTSEVDPATG